MNRATCEAMKVAMGICAAVGIAEAYLKCDARAQAMLVASVVVGAHHNRADLQRVYDYLREPRWIGAGLP